MVVCSKMVARHKMVGVQKWQEIGSSNRECDQSSSKRRGREEVAAGTAAVQRKRRPLPAVRASVQCRYKAGQLHKVAGCATCAICRCVCVALCFQVQWWAGEWRQAARWAAPHA